MDEALVFTNTWPMVEDIASKFLRMNRYLDQDELEGELRVVMVQAMRSYDASRGTQIRSWICTVIKRYMSKYILSRLWRQRFCKSLNGHKLQRPLANGKLSGTPSITRTIGGHPVQKESFNLERFTFQLSDEAEMAIEIAIERRQKKIKLSKTLLSEFGWEKSLLKKVFQEIRECL